MKVNFTAGRIAAFTCPPDRKQAFLWDSDTRGLGLRVTPNGKPTYIFQRQHEGKTVRMAIGSPDAWSIEKARREARTYWKQMDDGDNPAEVKSDAAKAKQERKAQGAITVSQAWGDYLEARRPQPGEADRWGERHYTDHLKMAAAGGETATRGTRGRGKTIAGPLHQFMAMPLRDVTADVVATWASKESKTRPSVARLALRLLKAFLNWCAENKEYKAVADTGAASSKKAREKLGKAKPKKDALMREQLPAWFAAVRQLDNPVIAAALQVMLLTGARPGEVLAMRWNDLNHQWRGINMRDKVEGDREIPLTPYVAHLLASLPRRGPFVFQSTVNDETPRPISSPNSALDRVSTVAGIDHLTLHGLRRSFKSLSEWLELPAGVAAQIMGHKPSATAEKHYAVRELGMLRVHHERFEAWILEQAGIPFDPAAEPGKLRAVA